ncbi:MAG: histidine--tRNA ligase, partial [Candidatus Latescibacteria bacterium]|nr:histidine--tRNA ligase [Candidatus Latescibacterota bacterium]
MPPLYRAPRGTRDLLPDDRPFWDFVEQTARNLAERYGFRRIDTPTFEDTGLFVRAVGEGTDIVDKEMYTFQDKGQNSLTLRSEGTAPVIRAYLERGMHVLPQPVKLYYMASIFRYDRPQAGRYREHRQFGVEAVGETDPAVDTEVIALASDFYAGLGLSGISLQINSIGCPECRPPYLKRLAEAYDPLRNRLCENCQRRIDTNPLRLLDCKVESCRSLLARAPKITDSLCEACREHLGTLREHLDELGIAYTLDPLLVRGLDYYTKTVFEFWAEGIGAQNAVGGGGRYDGLAELLGGSGAPGIGFGIGIDRAILTLVEQGIEVPTPPPPVAFVVSLGDEARKRVPALNREMRAAGLQVASLFGGRSMRAQMRQANASGASYALILGEDEMERGEITCREMATGEQTDVPLADIVDYL